MEQLEKLIHQELQRNTATTDDARALAEEVKAQVPVVQQTLVLVERNGDSFVPKGSVTIDVRDGWVTLGGRFVGGAPGG